MADPKRKVDTAEAGPSESAGGPPKKKGKEKLDVPGALEGKPENKIQKRPDSGGREGAKVMVLVNHFVVNYDKDIDIRHYDVGITDPAALRSSAFSRKLIGRMLADNAERFGGRQAVFDRKNLYVVGPLPFQQEVFEVATDAAQPQQQQEAPARPARTVRVVVTAVAAVPDVAALRRAQRAETTEIPYNVLTIFDIALRESLTRKMTPVGRSLFSRELGTRPLGFGVEAWMGFYQSLRLTQQGLALVVDQSCSAFVAKQPVEEYVKALLGRRDLSDGLSNTEYSKVRKALVKLTVETTHLEKNIKFNVTSVTNRGAQEIRFPLSEDGAVRQELITDYFRQKYRPLRYPQMPCLEKGRKQDHPILFPLEVCTIVPGQHYKMKLREQQVAEMLRMSATKPHMRKNAISNIVHNNGYERDDYARAFGLEVVVERELPRVPARVLPPPKIQYRGQPFFPNQPGSWNMRGKMVMDGAQVKRWTLVTFAADLLPHKRTQELLKELIRTCTDTGLRFEPAPFVVPNRGDSNDPGSALRLMWKAATAKAAGQRPLDLIFCLLRDRGSTCHGEIKRICETELGVVTQCMQFDKLDKGGVQYYANIALKINVKGADGRPQPRA